MPISIAVAAGSSGMRADRLAPLVWLLFALLPVDGWGLIDGPPWRSLEVGALLAAIWVWMRGQRLPGGVWPPALLLLCKVASALVLVPQGFTATYFANAVWAAPAERSPEFPRSPFTRIDRRLQFDAPTGPHLPLFFFNDNTRFNFYRPDEPGRGELPFSVVWDGYVWTSSFTESTIAMRGDGLEAVMLVDGQPFLRKGMAEAESSASLAAGPGWTRIVVQIAAPHGRARAFEVTSDRSGVIQPLGAPDVYTRALSPAHLTLDRILRVITRTVDAGVLVCLAWTAIVALTAVIRTLLETGRGRLLRSPPVHALFAIGLLAAFTDALAFARLVDGRLLLLSGGNDMLTYETFARDIALNGPLMLLGLPIGEAEAFYFQPFYPYFLALAHVLFGEDAFGVFLLQRLGLWLSLFATVSAARQLFGTVAAAGALAAGGLFLYVKVSHWTSVQLSEMLFVPLACLCLREAIALAGGAGMRSAVATGVLGGAASLTRSTFAAAWLFALPIVWLARRRAGWSTRLVLVAALVLGSVIGLATLRNWIAAGRFVPVATSGPVVLLLGNPPPPGTPDHDDHRHAVLGWWAPDDRTRTVVEGALHQPAAFVANLARKALYALGFFGAFVPSTGWSPVFVVMWSTALVGLLCRRDAFAASPDALAAWLPAILAACHFAAVTVFVPHVYGDRLVLPFYVLLIPYVGAAVALVIGAASATFGTGRYGTVTRSSSDGGLVPQ